MASAGLTEAGRGAGVLAVFAFALGACGWSPLGEAPTDCGWPPGTELAFAGETSLSELGLDEGSPGVDIRGMAYVTAERLTFPERGIRPQRWFCFVSAEDPAFTGPVPDNWQPAR